MEYKQSIQTHYIGSDEIVLTYTYKSADGHMYLIDDLYIVVNGRAIHVPASWKTLLPVTVVRKVAHINSRLAA